MLIKKKSQRNKKKKRRIKNIKKTKDLSPEMWNDLTTII